MKAAIVYCSKHGTTEMIASLLAEKFAEYSPILFNLKKNSFPDISGFDMVIIGGSIYGGKVQDRVKSFCKQNLDLLLEKKVGLYICCMQKDKETELLNEAYPEELRKHSKANGCFGGELLFEKLNFFEKWIIKKVAHVYSSTSKINYSAIGKFVVQFENAREAVY